MNRHWTPIDERGFTLIEVLITIIILGIVLTIASSSWIGAIESRRVDDGTNRLTADLRQAHSRAINRLAPQTVTLTSGSSKYVFGPTSSSCSATPGNPGCVKRDLDDFPDAGDDLVVVKIAGTITFNSNGSATVTGANPITVESSKDTTKNHTIAVTATTSEIRVVP